MLLLLLSAFCYIMLVKHGGCLAGLKPYDNEQQGSVVNSLAYYSLQSLLFNAHGLNKKNPRSLGIQIIIIYDIIIKSKVRYVSTLRFVLQQQLNIETGRNVSQGVLLLIRLPSSTVGVQRDK